jgi:hypothetical protein
VVGTRYRGGAHQAETSATVGHAGAAAAEDDMVEGGLVMQKTRAAAAGGGGGGGGGGAVDSSSSRHATLTGAVKQNHKTLRESCSNKSVLCPPLSRWAESPIKLATHREMALTGRGLKR